MMGAGADDGSGDLMAYNAYPSGNSSMSAAFGGFDSPQQHQQHQQQLQAQLPPQQQQIQQQQQLVQQQLQQQQQEQLRAQMQQQALQQQAQQQAQAYALAPARTSTVPAQPTMVSLTPKGAPPSPASGDYRGGDDSDPGYLELMWQRRRDVAKLCILSLVVLFAISLHSASWHYLREYIETAARLTYWQEVGLRVAYPIVVVFLLWNLKATV
jgi:hypothetical protein